MARPEGTSPKNLNHESKGEAMSNGVGDDRRKHLDLIQGVINRLAYAIGVRPKQTSVMSSAWLQPVA